VDLAHMPTRYGAGEQRKAAAHVLAGGAVALQGAQKAADQGFRVRAGSSNAPETHAAYRGEAIEFVEGLATGRVVLRHQKWIPKPALTIWIDEFLPDSRVNR